MYIDRLAQLWLVQQPNNNNAMINIARTFRALKESLLEMKSYYYKVEGGKISLGRPRFPYFGQGVHAEDDCQIVYHKRVAPHLFHAEMSNNEVFVKFTETYCEDAHKLLFEKGFAPQLFHVKCVGRFKAVVMKVVKNAVCILPYLESHTEAKQCLLSKCREALDILSDNNYCHGDLRPCNILVGENQDICVVDFDWAGKSGTVKYPFFMNHDEVTPPPDLYI